VVLPSRGSELLWWVSYGECWDPDEQLIVDIDSLAGFCAEQPPGVLVPIPCELLGRLAPAVWRCQGHQP
jgi:hypothetical protein